MTDPPKKALTLEELREKEPVQLGPDGRTTIEHLRWKLQVVNQAQTDALFGIRELPKGVNLSQAKDLIETEAKQCGYDPKKLLDTRTGEQVLEDAITSLIETPASLFEVADEILDKIAEQMDRADTMLIDECGASNQRVRDARLAKKETDRIAAIKKAWGERIRKLKRIRERARNPFPEGSAPGNKPALAAAHVLRFMLYVGRDSDVIPLCVGDHHGKAALALYEAENGRRWQNLEWIDCEFVGIMFVFPPGHGKSTFAAHRYGLRIAQRPTLRVMHGHAQAGEAEKNLKNVANMFDPETAQGRRLRSLFPNVPGIARLTHNIFDLEPVGGEKKRQPTMVAHGITAKVSGADADDIWFDDPCDQELAEQETTRQRVYDRMNGTWRTRKREKADKRFRTFEFTTTTLWHHDDPNARRIALVRQKKLNLRVKIMACGGPEDGFKALWPEVYPASKLKAKYVELGAKLYGAAYRSNPQPQELRRVKKLRFYDPRSDEHQDFMAQATFYLSIDPSATNSSTSDHASMVYGALGDLTGDMDGAVSYTRKLRIVLAEEFKASQGEAVDKVVAFARHQRVDEILWESRGATSAGPEMLEREYGLSVTIVDPKNRDKLLRLEDVAPLLDASMADKGLPEAAIEFPGLPREDGTIGPDPEYSWYYQQILDAGVAVADHALDATTQLAKRLMGELRIGAGTITEQVRRNEEKGDPRVREFLRHALGRSTNTPVAEQDYVFCANNMGNRSVPMWN